MYPVHLFYDSFSTKIADWAIPAWTNVDRSQFASASSWILSFCYHCHWSLFCCQTTASCQLCYSIFHPIFLSKICSAVVGGIHFRGLHGAKFVGSCPLEQSQMSCLHLNTSWTTIFVSWGLFVFIFFKIISRNRTTAIGRARLSEVIQKDSTQLELIRAIPTMLFWYIRIYAYNVGLFGLTTVFGFGFILSERCVLPKLGSPNVVKHRPLFANLRPLLTASLSAHSPVNLYYTYCILRGKPVDNILKVRVTYLTQNLFSWFSTALGTPCLFPSCSSLVARSDHTYFIWSQKTFTG